MAEEGGRELGTDCIPLGTEQGRERMMANSLYTAGSLSRPVVHEARVRLSGQTGDAVARGCCHLVLWHAVYEGGYDGVHQEGAVCEQGGCRGR